MSLVDRPELHEALAEKCPTCTSSKDGYCPMWNMGMSEPCPIYRERPDHKEAPHA